MLINLRSIKKPNAVYHLHADLINRDMHICFVTESWLQKKVKNSFIAKDNYCIERRDRDNVNSIKELGDGVCCFIRQGRQYERLYPLGEDKFEILWLEIRFGNYLSVFGVVYYRPGSTYGNELIEHIQRAKESLFQISLYHAFVICGDLNSLNIAALKNICGLHVVNGDPTRGSSTIDLFLSSGPTYLAYQDTFQPLGETDHLAVQVSIVETRQTHRTVHFRDQRQKFKDRVMDALNHEKEKTASTARNVSEKPNKSENRFGD